MTKVYATIDSDGHRIHNDAAIYAFNTVAEAEAWLREPYSDSGYYDGVTVVAGEFGDCWIKSLHQPRPCDAAYKPFTHNQLNISGPGTHPHGRGWWITPRPDVLVAIPHKAA